MNSIIIIGIIELSIALAITITGCIYLFKNNARKISFTGYYLTIFSIIISIVLIKVLPEIMPFLGVFSLFLSALASIPLLKIYHFPLKNVLLAAIAVSLISFGVNVLLIDETQGYWVISVTCLAIWGIPFAFFLGMLANMWLLKYPMPNILFLRIISFVNATILNALFWIIMHLLD